MNLAQLKAELDVEETGELPLAAAEPFAAAPAKLSALGEG